MVEDDPDVRASLQRRLKFEGFQVEAVERGEQALEMFSEVQPNLVLLDVMLPGIDGFTVAERIREVSNVPILMLTARDAVEDRVGGLERGADDYLVKPFEMPELIARLRALLRRSNLASDSDSPGSEETKLSFGHFALDTKTREVTSNGEPVDLTPREFDLLEFFLRHPRQVLTRDQILEAVWGYESEASSNLVDVYIRQIRKKMDNSGTRLLQTVRGVGYSLKD